MEKDTLSQEKLDKSLKLMVKTSFFVLITLIISKILTYFYRIIIARSLGPEIYGLFSLALVISGLFIAFFSLGLQEGLTRYIAFYRGKKETGKIQHIIRFALKFLFFSGIFAAFLLFFLSETISVNFFHNPELTIFLKWFSIFIPLSIFAGIFHLILRAYEKIKLHSFVSNILQTSVQLIFLIFLLFLGLKSTATIFSYILGVFILLLSAFTIARYKINEIFKKPKIDKKTKKDIIKKLMSYSWPLMFMSVILFVFYWTDSITIGYFMDVSAVGIYNAAIPIAALIVIAPTLFIQLFFPLITREYARKNINFIKEIAKQVSKWIFIINFPFILIMIIFPGAVINLFFGAEYISGAGALRFIALGTFFYGLFILSENLLSMVGKSKTIFFNTFSTAIVNLILNIILVPRYGLNGAGISTMFSYLIWGLLSFFQAKHYVSIIPFRRKMFRIMLVTLLPLALLLIIKKLIPLTTLSLIMQGLLFMLLYYILIFLTGCFDKNDLMIIKTIKNRLSKNDTKSGLESTG